MRFMIIVKATKDSEAGVMPEEKLIAAMATYHEELAKAGALLDASGLQPSSKGWRIKYSGEADRDRWALRRDEGAHRRLYAHPGEVEGGGIGMGQSLPNPQAMNGRRNRGTPAIRAGGLRSQRGDRALSQDGGWEEEVVRSQPVVYFGLRRTTMGCK